MALDVLRSEPGRATPCAPEGRPAPVMQKPAEEPPDVLFMNRLLEEIEPFIKNMDLEGALSAIRTHREEFRDMPISMEEFEGLITLHFEYMGFLRTIDDLAEEGKFEEAFELVEEKRALIESVGKDPEQIKGSVKDMESLMGLVEESGTLHEQGKTKEALELIYKNSPLLERLNITPEYFIENVFQEQALPLR